MSNTPSSTPAGSGEFRALAEAIHAFVAEREWQPFHDPKNLAMAVAVEAAELMEHFRWCSSEQSRAVLADPRARPEIEHEVADVLILLIEFCSIAGIDPAAAVRAKLQLNAQRYPVALSKGHSRKYNDLQRPDSTTG
jgi:dCTP diphosphatase